MIPSNKTNEMESALTGVFGFDRREVIHKNKCAPPPIGCGELAIVFDDELSQQEYRISGLCQKCQDKIFGVSHKKRIAIAAVTKQKEIGPNDLFIPRRGMICGSNDAQARVFEKHVGKSGNTWLVAVQENAAANVYVTNNPANTTSRNQGFEGFGGSTLSFPLTDGTVFEAHGPWHTNSDALYEDTGVDVRNRHFTWVALGMDRDHIDSATIIRGVVYKDEQPTLGSFNRYKEIIKLHPEALVYFMESEGGSSSGAISEKDRL